MTRTSRQMAALNHWQLFATALRPSPTPSSPPSPPPPTHSHPLPNQPRRQRIGSCRQIPMGGSCLLWGTDNLRSWQKQRRWRWRRFPQCDDLEGVWVTDTNLEMVSQLSEWWGEAGCRMSLTIVTRLIKLYSIKRLGAHGGHDVRARNWHLNPSLFLFNME